MGFRRRVVVVAVVRRPVGAAPPAAGVLQPSTPRRHREEAADRDTRPSEAVLGVRWLSSHVGDAAVYGIARG